MFSTTSILAEAFMSKKCLTASCPKKRLQVFCSYNCMSKNRQQYFVVNQILSVEKVSRMLYVTIWFGLMFVTSDCLTINYFCSLFLMNEISLDQNIITRWIIMEMFFFYILCKDQNNLSSFWDWSTFAIHVCLYKFARSVRCDFGKWILSTSPMLICKKEASRRINPDHFSSEGHLIL